jgi:hypothetical protein
MNKMLTTENTEDTEFLKRQIRQAVCEREGPPQYPYLRRPKAYFLMTFLCVLGVLCG